MTDSTFPLYPTFALLGVVLSLIPLPWHLQVWNSGTCYFMIWSALACLNQFINSIIWSGNLSNPAPIWCEISIRIIMASSIGLPAASLCINRRLNHIATAQSISITKPEKIRSFLVDSCICLLFPLVIVALQYIVQGHRFDIIEDIGCYPALYNTIPTYFLSYMWPVLIGMASAYYAFMTLRRFHHRRAEFNRMLSNSTLTFSRYFRLMALAMTDILLTTPLSIFVIWVNATANPIRPWISWDDTHFNYSRIARYPSIVWRQSHILSISFEFSRWMPVVCAIVFFAFFGFADEAKRNYRELFSCISKPLRSFLPREGFSRIINKRSQPHKFAILKPKETPLPLYSPSQSSTLYLKQNDDKIRGSSLSFSKSSDVMTLDVSPITDKFPHSSTSHDLTSSTI